MSYLNPSHHFNDINQLSETKTWSNNNLLVEISLIARMVESLGLYIEMLSVGVPYKPVLVTFGSH